LVAELTGEGITAATVSASYLGRANVEDAT